MVTNGSEAARQAFAARLNEMLDDVGFARHGEGRQVELARLFGVSQKGARKWVMGEAIPETTRLTDIVQHFSYRVEWLLSGQGPKRTDADERSGARDGRYKDSVLASWPRVKESTPAADTGFLSIARRVLRLNLDGSPVLEVLPGPPLTRSTEELARMGVTDAKQLAICTMVGNAMFPFVLPDRAVLVAIDQVDVRRYNDLPWTERVFAVSHRGAIRLRILQSAGDDQVRVSAWNATEHPAETVPASALLVLGRMVGHA